MRGMSRFLSPLSRGREGSAHEAIWLEGERAGNTGPGGEGREMRESGSGGVMERLGPRRDAQGGGEQRAGAARRRREGTAGPPGPASVRPSNAPPSSSGRRAPLRVPGTRARGFPAGAGPAERLHLHKVPAPRPAGAAGRGVRCSEPGGGEGRGRAASGRAGGYQVTRPPRTPRLRGDLPAAVWQGAADRGGAPGLLAPGPARSPCTPARAGALWGVASPSRLPFSASGRR